MAGMNETLRKSLLLSTFAERAINVKEWQPHLLTWAAGIGMADMMRFGWGKVNKTGRDIIDQTYSDMLFQLGLTEEQVSEEERIDNLLKKAGW